MIDWNKSAELNKCTVEWLKSRFERFPYSVKKVIRICNGCGKEEDRYFHACGDLCRKCTTRLPEARKAARLKSLEQWSSQEARDEMSEIIKNSDACKVVHNKQIGGLDLVWHHVAYDFGRPEALRVKITRSFHGQIHSPKDIPVNKRGYSLID